MTDDVRQRILHAAGPIFAERGFQAATVRDICESAGVNLAAVNYYFGDKEHLYLEVVHAARRMRATEAPMPEWSPETPTAVKLRDYIRTTVTRMVGLEEAPWQVRLMMREVMQPSAACRELVSDYFRPHLELLLGIIDETLPAETPLHRRHQIGFSIIGQCFFYRVAGQVVGIMVGQQELAEHYSIEQLADHITQFAFAALGLEPPRSVPNPAVEDSITEG